MRCSIPSILSRSIDSLERRRAGVEGIEGVDGIEGNEMPD